MATHYLPEPTAGSVLSVVVSTDRAGGVGVDGVSHLGAPCA